MQDVYRCSSNGHDVTMQRRGGRDVVDVEGGDAPAFGDHAYDDDDKNAKKRSSGVMGGMGGVGMGTLSSMSSNLGAAASFGRVFHTGDSAPDEKFFLDLRDKLLMVRCCALTPPVGRLEDCTCCAAFFCFVLTCASFVLFSALRSRALASHRAMTFFPYNRRVVSAL